MYFHFRWSTRYVILYSFITNERCRLHCWWGHKVESDLCYILTFDPAKNAIPRWYTGRKWHILMAVMRGNRVGGNWLMKWDEVKKFPWYTHRLTHRKRVTCELHDSYFRLMTIKHAISKIEWAIEWALNYYITQSRQMSRQLSSSTVGEGMG